MADGFGPSYNGFMPPPGRAEPCCDCTSTAAACQPPKLTEACALPGPAASLTHCPSISSCRLVVRLQAGPEGIREGSVLSACKHCQRALGWAVYAALRSQGLQAGGSDCPSKCSAVSS